MFIHVYIYIYNSCAWTPNRDSRTYQLGSLCNRYPGSRYPGLCCLRFLRLPLRLPLATGNIGLLGLRLPEATSQASEATSDNGKS